MDFLLARPLLLVLQPENFVVVKMDRAEGLFPTLGIEPMFQRQLFLENLFEFAIGVIAGIVFIVVLVVFIVVKGPSRPAAAPRTAVVKRAIVRHALLMQGQERAVTLVVQRQSRASKDISASTVGAFQLFGIEARFGVL